jgi:hypothetical protein
MNHHQLAEQGPMWRLEDTAMRRANNPYDRVSVIVGVILVGIVLLLVVDVPPRTFQFRPLGTPLTFNVTAVWAMSMLLVGLSCAGTEAVMRVHPLVRRGAVKRTFPNWVLPALATLALAVSLPRSPDLLGWLIGLAVGGGGLAWLILMNYQAIAVEVGDPSQSAVTARLGLRLAAYPLASILFTAIYRTRLRSLVTATSVTLVAALLAFSILYYSSQAHKSLGRTVLYSGVIGLVVGETTWALNYWRANALTVGVVLMLLFYVLTGIVREYTRAGIRWQTVVEFLVVAALGIWIVVRFGPG